MKVHWIRRVSFLTKIVDNICNQTFLPEETVLFLPMYRVLPSCGENFATLYSLPPMGKEFWCLWIATSPLEDRILYPVLIQEWILLPFESLTQILVKNFATICVESSLPGEIILLSFDQVFLFWERILLAFVSSPLSVGEEFCCNCIESPPPGKIIFVRCIILYWLYQGQDSKKKTFEKPKQKQKKKSKKSLSSLYLVIRFQNNSGDARYVSFIFWMFSLQNQEHYRSGSLKNLILDTNMCYLLPTLA